MVCKLGAISLSSKNVEEELKTSKLLSVTVSVTFELRVARVASNSSLFPTPALLKWFAASIAVTLARLLVLCSFPRIFEKKRDCSRGLEDDVITKTDHEP